MKGVSFGNIHSHRDLNLILAPFEIPAPTVKENYVDVPGSDAGVDLTAAHGEVKYNYNEFDLTFTALPSDDWERKKRQVTNLLHGLECDLVFDRNPNYRLTGRVSVSERKSNKMLRQFVIHCKTNPYWQKTTDTEVFAALGTSVNLADRIGNWIINDNRQRFVRNNDVGVVSAATNIMSPEIPYTGGTLSFSAEYEYDEPENNSSSNSVRVYIWSYDSNDVLTRNNFNLVNGKYENYTPPADCVYFKVRVQPGSSTVGNIRIKKFQVESGSVCTTYSPKNGVLIVNENRPVIPKIMVTANTTITDSKGNTFSLSAGTHKILDISVPTGESIITGTGNGTLTVTFTERAL